VHPRQSYFRQNALFNSSLQWKITAAESAKDCLAQ